MDYYCNPEVFLMLHRPFLEHLIDYQLLTIYFWNKINLLTQIMVNFIGLSHMYILWLSDMSLS